MRADLRRSWLVPALLTVVVVAAFVAPIVIARSGRSSADPAPVTRADAHRVVDQLVARATDRTTTAMHDLCDFAREGCLGMSGGLEHDPLAYLSAPHPSDPVHTRCERAVGDGGWMVVLEGIDGFGRDYVSQVVLYRARGGHVLLEREPAYWLGIGYDGPKVTGSTAWSMAHNTRVDAPNDGGERAEQVLARARASCAPRSEGGAV